MHTDPAGLLRERGLRVTAPRRAVLDVLDHGSHLSADAIVSSVRERVGAASTQGIYNVLNDLVAAGLVHRIEPAGHPALFELSRTGRHHHIICRHCGRLIDLTCDHDVDDCLLPSDTHGFRNIEADIVFWGTCPDCQPATD